MFNASVRLMRNWRIYGSVAAVLALCGCGTSSDADHGAGRTEQADEELVSYDWRVDPGIETYYCVYKTVTEDVWISELRSLSPPGTHHVVLGFGSPGPADGVYSSVDTADQPPCTGVTGVAGVNTMTFFAGVGTGGLKMPERVAVKVPAGKQLVLGIHLFNTQDAALAGRSGVQVVRAVPSKVDHEAEVVAASKFPLTVPPGRSTQSTTCTMVGDVNLFAVAPHMHLAGKQMTTSAVSADGTRTTLLDTEYQFEQQGYTSLDPQVPLHKGDHVEVNCGYMNSGASSLSFGESTNAEMCITFLYRYPAVGTDPNCIF